MQMSMYFLEEVFRRLWEALLRVFEYFFVNKNEWTKIHIYHRGMQSVVYFIIYSYKSSYFYADVKIYIADLCITEAGALLC